MTAIRRFTTWLGPERSWTLFGLLGGTGALSLILQAVDTETGAPWVVPAQNGLILIWLVGTAMVVGGRLAPENRRLLVVSIGPLVVGLLLGVIVPGLMPWFVGAGLGWLGVSQYLIRRNVRREYRQAILHLRRNEYDEAITLMNSLIKAEPQDSGHYRFRAELYRLKGKPKRALEDYRRIIALEPDSGVGYNGMAEVHLQENELEEALKYARLAYEREPDHWVMPYNLGMIEDRRQSSEDALVHLSEALQLGIPDSRHRLLVHLWLARSHATVGQVEETEHALATLRQEKRGLKEWQTLFKSEQANTLRHVLAADVALAQQIVDGAGAEVFATEVGK